MHQIENQLIQIWPEWKIVETIGTGSYSIVFRIERKLYDDVQVSALKVLEIPREINNDEIAIFRGQGLTEKQIADYYYDMVMDVVNEITIMYKFQGISNIVSYQDHAIVEKEEGEIGWFIFIRMEYLTQLNYILANERPTIADGIKIGMDLCRALDICEKNNIIHRDIKPENIFRSEQGDYKLGDFGIARKLEKTVSVMTSVGTFRYMAPEVHKGMPYDMSVDIYSLGILLYQLFNDMRLPFFPPITEPQKHSDEENAFILRINGTEMPPPRNVDERLSKIILKACAFDPKDRYESANELYNDLQNSLIHESNVEDDNSDDETIFEIISKVGIIAIPIFISVIILVVVVTKFLPDSGSNLELKSELEENVERKVEADLETDVESVANICTKDISGIIHQMKNKYGKEIMNDSIVYELSMGSYGYVIQTKSGNDDYYSFLLPRADANLKETVMDEDGLFKKSLQAGVLYMMDGMSISAPAKTENDERIVINNQSLILSKITLNEYPNVFDGCPSLAYLLTDDDHRIRRIMILTSDGFLVRADYTYDDNLRIIKEHWTSVWMYEEEWKKMGWFSQVENKITASEIDVEKYIKDMIVLLPNEFVQASPSGKNYENKSTYVYDEQGFLKEIDFINEDKRIEWTFSYENALRTNSSRIWVDDSTGEHTEQDFVYERYKSNYIEKVDFDESFKTENELETKYGNVNGFLYSYYDDGTMNLEVIK